MDSFPPSYRAITIWQPWASLIIAGAKPYEWRRWAAPRAMIGVRLAIHAGARKPRVDEMRKMLYDMRVGGEAATSLVPSIAGPLLERWVTSPELLPVSSILGFATLGQPIRATDYAAGAELPADSTRIDHSVWGWPLSDIEALEPFAPARGGQGFWTWRRVCP